MSGGNISGMLGADVKASYSVESVTHQVPGGATVPAPLLISLRNVVKDYDGLAGTVRVLQSLSLEVRKGEFVGVCGPSGSGKSTLIKNVQFAQILRDVSRWVTYEACGEQVDLDLRFPQTAAGRRAGGQAAAGGLSAAGAGA